MSGLLCSAYSGIRSSIEASDYPTGPLSGVRVPFRDEYYVPISEEMIDRRVFFRTSHSDWICSTTSFR